MPIINSLLSVIAPFSCLVCEREGRLLCQFCSQDALPAVPSRCYRCQSSTEDFKVCSKCRPQAKLNRVWVRTSYQLTAENIIRKYKFNHAMSAAELIAEEIDEALPVLEQNTVVVAVPTANYRRRYRGYDHAQLIARRIARNRRITTIQPIVRISQSRQVGASRKQRFEQLENAFLVAKPNQIIGRKILLIDDIVTTGATLEKLANLLRKYGAKSVDAAVFAQRFK